MQPCRKVGVLRLRVSEVFVCEAVAKVLRAAGDATGDATRDAAGDSAGEGGRRCGTVVMAEEWTCGEGAETCGRPWPHERVF